jgi:hypothetical protein
VNHRGFRPQDTGKRGVIDKELEQQRYAEFEKEELKEQETARQWRLARGVATAEDLQGPKKTGPVEREDWITVLPAARRPSAPSQKSQVPPPPLPPLVPHIQRHHPTEEISEQHLHRFIYKFGCAWSTCNPGEKNPTPPARRCSNYR